MLTETADTTAALLKAPKNNALAGTPQRNPTHRFVVLMLSGQLQT
ncbi:hypothetical protein [Pirellula sp. SH-Sr6A]|nr:hypothetical protein [Pirellula sp. SH-Sr6A]